MRIGILQTGDIADELIPEYGNYPELFARLISPLDEHFDFVSYRAHDGELPDATAACDGWLISGSKVSAYDPLPWIPPLQVFIRQIAQSKKPLVGICFGHQIIAQALGGKVEKSDKGWGLGTDTYEIDPDNSGHQSQSISLAIFHQDQVVKLPPGAEVFASSDFCPYAGLYIGSRIMTLQAHPEFQPNFTLALIKARRESIEPQSLVDTALDQVLKTDTRDDSRRFAERIGAFFLSAAQT